MPVVVRRRHSGLLLLLLHARLPALFLYQIFCCHPATLAPLPQENDVTGGLPPGWGSWERGGLPKLRVLSLSGNTQLGGTLPTEWSRQRAFPSLKTL